MSRSRFFTRSLIPLIVSILLILAASQSAQAITNAVINLVVDTPSDSLVFSGCDDGVDDDDCSLRGAIQYANLGEAGFEYHITIPAATYTLTGASGENLNVTGDLDILSRMVTLTGAGIGLTILDGNSLDRVLDNQYGIVTLMHLTISQGRAPSGDAGGGGILNRYGSSTMTLIDVLVDDNEVLGSSQYSDVGGGIANSNGTLSILDSTITNNEACNGGGVNSRGGPLVIKGSTISTNLARSSTSCGTGGGVATFGGGSQLNLSHVIVEENDATNSGGIFYNGTTPSSGIINDSTIRGNTAEFTGGLNNLGDLTLNRVTISGNQSTNFGGGVTNRAALTMINVTISGNSASHGAGIQSANGSSTFLDHVTVANNTAIWEGYALYANANSTTSIHNSILASGSTEGKTCLQEVDSHITNLGFNLSSDHSCGFITTAPYFDLIDTGPTVVGPLQNNGGPTQTMAILWGGAAIDRADPVNTQIKDQRSAYRPVNGDVVPGAVSDIGAYEYGSFPPSLYFWLPLIRK